MNTRKIKLVFQLTSWHFILGIFNLFTCEYYKYQRLLYKCCLFYVPQIISFSSYFYNELLFLKAFFNVCFPALQFTLQIFLTCSVSKPS